MREVWLNGMTEWKMEWTSNAPISAMLSSLSRCPIFRQVAHCVGVIVRLVCNWVLVHAEYTWNIEINAWSKIVGTQTQRYSSLESYF